MFVAHLKKILRRIFKRKIIKDFSKFCDRKYGHALLYYKTDYYTLGGVLEDRSHTNEWESYEISVILNRLGFWVDIYDRTVELKDIEKIEDKYDIFIGIGVGDSGRYFKNIAKKLTKAVRVIYALGPEPELSNRNTKNRHDFFLTRHPGSKIVVRRLVKDIEITESMKFVDKICTNCNKWGIEGYRKFHKDIYRVWLSSHPDLHTSCVDLISRDPQKFLYFGGNGNITKGLDLTIEAFSKLPELELYIGAPKTEEDFNLVMNPILEESSNIHFIGFMDIKSLIYKDITSKCGYVILPSSSEGCATSVTTCMRRGLIPVVTMEAGVDVGDFGHIIQDINVGKLCEQIREIANEPKDRFIDRSIKTYLESFKYTQDNFSKTFEAAVLMMLAESKKIIK
jgi:hypothetical protein